MRGVEGGDSAWRLLLALCHVSTHGCAAGVPAAFTLYGKKTLPPCSPHGYSATDRMFPAQPRLISVH